MWDVHTNANRWWVITAPLNLYAQDQFPNMDLALTFHVGLCLRVPRSDRQKLADIPAEPFAECLRGLGARRGCGLLSRIACSRALKWLE